MQKQKSKSQILETIFEQVDEQLSLIPDYDWDGSIIQDSMHFDMHVIQLLMCILRMVLIESTIHLIKPWQLFY